MTPRYRPWVALRPLPGNRLAHFAVLFTFGNCTYGFVEIVCNRVPRGCDGGRCGSALPRSKRRHLGQSAGGAAGAGDHVVELRARRFVARTREVAAIKSRQATSPD